MSEHWEFAIAEAKGEYMLIIGDDDGLPSQAMEHMKNLLKNNPTTDAISWPLNVFYYPDIPDPNLNGMLYHYGGELLYTRTADVTLRLYLAGRLSYADLPGIYHKLARTSLVRSVIVDGIKGIAPDVTIASAMLPQLHDYLYTRNPLSIPGNSPRSNGFATLSHKGDKDQAAIFLSETAITIAEPFANLSIPLESNVSLMQLEVITKLRRVGVIDASLHFDYVRFLRLAREEGWHLPNDKKDLLDEDLWNIYQSLSGEGGGAFLTREQLFDLGGRSVKGRQRWAHGEATPFRLTRDYPNIEVAMPVIEHSLEIAGIAFAATVSKTLPEISRHLRKQEIAGVFLSLTELEFAIGADLLHLILSPTDLLRFLAQQFPDQDTADLAFSLAYSYYLVFEHADVDSHLSVKLKAISMDLDPIRFRLLTNKLLSSDWSDLRATYLTVWYRAFKLRSMGFQAITPALFKIRKYVHSKRAGH